MATVEELKEEAVNTLAEVLDCDNGWQLAMLTSAVEYILEAALLIAKQEADNKWQDFVDRGQIPKVKGVPNPILPVELQEEL